MNRRTVIALAVGLIILPIDAMAQRSSDEPPECVFRDELAAEMQRSAARSLTINEQAKAALDTIGRLTVKAKRPDTPLGEQLSEADAQVFQKERDRLAELEALLLLERRRQRDLGVINRMIAVADRRYRFGIEPESDGGGDDLAWSALKLIREALEERPLDGASRPNGCNLEGAIFGMKNETWRRIAHYDLAKVKLLGEQLQEKYGIKGAIDRDKLAPDDQNVWDVVVRDVVLPADRARGHLLDLEAALAALHASDIVYMSDMKDVQSSSGNPEQLGAGIKQQVEANEFDKGTIAAIGVWRIANENGKFK